MERLFKRPWIIVAVIGALTVFFALQLPRAQIDNNNLAFVPANEPSRLALQRVDETFGRQIVLFVGLERRYGSVLEADFIDKLRAFGKKVEGLESVEAVASLAETDYIDASGDSIVVGPLVPDDFSGAPAELERLRERILSWDLYRRALVSDDFKATQVAVTLDVTVEDAGSPEVMRVYEKVRALAQAEGFADTTLYFAGVPVFGAVVNEATGKDLSYLVPLVVLVVVVVLFLSFRRLGGVLLPLLTVLVAAVWTMGAMPLLGVKLSILSTVLPVILIAVGSAYGIHVVSHYYDVMAAGRALDREQHRVLVVTVLRGVIQPVFLAALTTFAGFVSFCATAIVPIFEFGLFSSFGVVASFAVAVTLIPALIIIRGPAGRTAGAAKAAGAPAEDHRSVAMADALCAIARKPRSVVVAACATVALSLFGFSRLVIDNVGVEYFKPDTDLVRAESFIRTLFGGSKTLSVIVSGDEPGEVLRPDVLAAMDGLGGYLLERVPEVGKTSSFTDMVKRVNHVLNADSPPEGLGAPSAPGPSAPGPELGGEIAFGFLDAVPEAAPEAARPAALPRPRAPLDEERAIALLDAALARTGERDPGVAELAAGLRAAVNYKGAAYYEIPTDPARYGKSGPEELKALVANYLVLLSGDISAVADDPLEPRSIRMTVQLRTKGQIDSGRVVRAIRGYVAERFPKDVSVEIAGDVLVEKALNDLVVQSQVSSVALSLLMVFLILAFYYRSAIAGLIGLVPLAISILVNFAVMGFAGIKLNLGTAMVASISVGIGIDYTIHYLSAYHREYLLSGGRGDYLRRTFLTSGKAIVFNAASVGLGFAVLVLSQFRILSSLGALIAITMVTSSLVSLTVLPVILDLAHPAFIRRPLRPRRNNDASEVRA